MWVRLHFTLNGESQKTEGGKENTTAFIFSDACPIFVKPLLFFITSLLTYLLPVISLNSKLFVSDCDCTFKEYIQ